MKVLKGRRPSPLFGGECPNLTGGPRHLSRFTSNLKLSVVPSRSTTSHGVIWPWITKQSTLWLPFCPSSETLEYNTSEGLVRRGNLSLGQRNCRVFKWIKNSTSNRARLYNLAISVHQGKFLVAMLRGKYSHKCLFKYTVKTKKTNKCACQVFSSTHCVDILPMPPKNTMLLCFHARLMGVTSEIKTRATGQDRNSRNLRHWAKRF